LKPAQGAENPHKGAANVDSSNTSCFPSPNEAIDTTACNGKGALRKPTFTGGGKLALKGKRSRKKNTRQLTYFREVKGKIIERVEIDPDLNAIIILFQDKTALSFNLEPRLTVFPELSDWKTGNWRGIKRWRAMHSKMSMVSWP
jgi:hypothetical protein